MEEFNLLFILESWPVGEKEHQSPRRQIFKATKPSQNKEQQLFSSPSRSLQYQGDVVQSWLIYNVPEGRDSNAALSDIFVAIEIAA